MSTGFSPEGGIDIALAVNRDRIADVSIANRRPLAVASRLEGLPVEAALQRVDALYSVCRIAQGLAGCMAVERALKIEPASQQIAARAFLLRGETVLEHATTALLYWPALLGERPAGISLLKYLRVSLSELWRSVYPAGGWARPGGGRLEPDMLALAARLAAAQDALEEAGLAVPLDQPAWRNWLGEDKGPAASLLRLLDTEALAGCGSSGVPLLERIDEAELNRLLSLDKQGAFAAQPEWEGAARETGPLARRMAEPVVREIVDLHGCGLAARFLAQCIETMRCLEEMRELAAQMRANNGQRVEMGDGDGLGLVAAARGWLAHRVEIADGRVRSYRILAPTEWNFHPRGPFALGLKGAWDPLPERLARLMVVALNPCVPWQIQIR